LSRGEFAPRSRRGEDEDEYLLPPALARLPANRGRLRREFIEQNQRDQILLAALTVFGTKGFAAATVKDLVEAASVSRATFYKFFSGVDACLLGLMEEVLVWLDEEAHDAVADAADWPGAVTAVTRRLVEVLLDDPRLARLCGIESLLGGPEVRAGREAAIESLVGGLRLGRDERSWGKRLPQSLEPLLVQGALALAATKAAHGPGPRAKALATELAEIILIPYLGAEDARRVVRPSPPRR
jgi:AcrR family transcriptional regulator